MVTFEAYGALAGMTGKIAGWEFVDGLLQLPDEEAEAAARVLTRFHTVRVSARERRDPTRPGRRASDYHAANPEPPKVVESPAPPPMEEPTVEPAAVETTPPVIMRPLEEEVLSWEPWKLEALVEGCDSYFLNRLIVHEMANQTREDVLALLQGGPR